MSNPSVRGNSRCPMGAALLALAMLLLVLGLRPAGAQGSIDNEALAQSSFDDTLTFRGGWMSEGVIAQTGNAASALALGLIDRLGGATKAVALQGNLVYTAEGSQLTILDITKPAAPVVAGKSPALPGIVTDITLAGDLAYVLAGGNLHILNLTYPVAPWAAGFYDLASGAVELEVSGSYAYVAAGGAGLYILDISQPTAISEIGHYDAPAGDNGPLPITSVAVSGSFAYIVAGGMRILNIVNPSSPAEVSAYDRCMGYSLTVRDIAVNGDNVFVVGSVDTEYMDSVFCVADVSDPAAPHTIASQYLSGAYNVSVAGNLAFIGSRPLYIFDISDPNWPFQLAVYETPGRVAEVASSAGYAFVADVGGGLRILDITDPDAPAEVSYYQPTGVATDVTLQGDHAYVAGDAALSIVHVVPAGMTSTAVLNMTLEDSLAQAHAVAVAGDYAALALGWDRFRVIDVSDPAAPFEAGRFEETGAIYDLALAGDFAYLADRGIAHYYDGLRILNMADPTAPVAAGFYDTPGWATGVAVTTNLVCVADGRGGLRIVDVTNPLSPLEVGYVDTPGIAWAVTVAGNLAFVAESTGGLAIVDIGDPAAPAVLSYVALPTAAWAVATSGDHIYVAAGDAGLRVLDVSDPTHPLQVGRYDTPGTASGVTIDGSDVLVADREGGLLRLRPLHFRVHMPLSMAAGLD